MPGLENGKSSPFSLVHQGKALVLSLVLSHTVKRRTRETIFSRSNHGATEQGSKGLPQHYQVKFTLKAVSSYV